MSPRHARPRGLLRLGLASFLTVKGIGVFPRAEDSVDGSASLLLLEAFDASVVAQPWRLAAEHWRGEGLQLGADIDASNAMVSMSGQLPRGSPLASPMVTIAAGGAWPRGRVATIIVDEFGSLCPRCGRVVETPFHRHWECDADPGRRAHELSAHLVSRARAEIGADPCFWIRGAIPA